MAITDNGHGIGMIFFLFYSMGFFMAAFGGNLYEDIEVTWGGQRAEILDGGKLLTLNLDKESGSGFQSKRQYMFGRIDMDIKLVGGNSAGTVTAFYVRLIFFFTHFFLVISLLVNFFDGLRLKSYSILCSQTILILNTLSCTLIIKEIIVYISTFKICEK